MKARKGQEKKIEATEAVRQKNTVDMVCNHADSRGKRQQCTQNEYEAKMKLIKSSP